MTTPGHIFLVGFMGAGKTSVGRLVASELGMAYVDLDEEIERAAGATVASVFAERGEEVFREIETDALLRLESHPACVVSCGGGVVLRSENRVALNGMGTVVYLQVTAAQALARIGDASTRPLLAGSGGTLAATALLSARESLYRSVADVEVDTVGRTPEEVAGLVVSALGE